MPAKRKYNSKYKTREEARLANLERAKRRQQTMQGKKDHVRYQLKYYYKNREKILEKRKQNKVINLSQ